MGLSPQLITNTLYARAKLELDTLKEDNRAAIRLRVIVSAKEKGVLVTAEFFDISTNTIRSWVRNYDEGGLAGLRNKAGRGRKGHLQEHHCQTIMEWVLEDPNLTLDKIVLQVHNVFGISTSKSAVQRILHKLKLSYITPRPRHHKQDKNSHSGFKKKSKRGYGSQP